MIAFQLMISWLAMTTPGVETTLREKIWWPQSKENVRLNKESSFRPAVVGGDTNHGDSVVGVLTDHSIKSFLNLSMPRFGIRNLLFSETVKF